MKRATGLVERRGTWQPVENSYDVLREQVELFYFPLAASHLLKVVEHA
ncbi:hypothetical protein AB1L42_07225 [Thalassoglobus sp. JC818]